MKKALKVGLSVLIPITVVLGLALLFSPKPKINDTALVAGQPLEEIIKDSEAILIGEVTKISGTRLASEGNHWFEDALGYREVTIKVDRFLYDSIRLNDEVKIVVLGGQMRLPLDVAFKKGNPFLVRHFADEAQFETGEKVLVFLKRGYIGYKKANGEEGRMNRLGLVGCWQGKFRVEGNKAVNYLPELSRDISEIEGLVKEVKQNFAKPFA